MTSWEQDPMQRPRPRKSAAWPKTSRLENWGAPAGAVFFVFNDHYPVMKNGYFIGNISYFYWEYMGW